MGISGDANKAIFISYCHADNDDTLGEGWIEQFHKVLRSRLKAITGVRNPEEELGIWRDKEIQGNEEFSQVLLEKINQAKIVISILSPSYITSEWCLREIDEFVKAANEEADLVVQNKARLFKVLKTPVDREKHPKSLRTQTGYEFYVIDKETRIPSEFSLLKGDGNTALALQKINDIAHGILHTLESLEQEEAKDTVDKQPISNAPTVYLAETSYDFDEERNQIRRELEAIGIRVLPEGDLPIRNPDQFRKAVHDALEQCSLSIHIIGACRSVGVAGFTDDTTRIQNQFAAEWSKDNKTNRLIWIPPDLSPEDEEQKKFIELLQTDSNTQSNAEVLMTPRHELLSVIGDSLKNPSQSEPEPAEKGVHIRKQIYVCYADEDNVAVKPLIDHLFDQGHEILESLSAPGADEQQIFEIHKRNLCDCDAVILFANSGGAFWLKMQLSEIQRSAAWRKNGPIMAVAIYITPTGFNENQRPRTHYDVIEGSEPFNPAVLSAFITPLGSGDYE
jgi:hypothetical protein